MALVLLAVLGGTAAGAFGQALRVQQLANGTEVIQVTQPLSDATSVAWLAAGAGRTLQVHSLAAGRLTLAAELEEQLGGTEEEPAPPVIVLVGGSAGSDIDTLLERLLAGRAPLAAPAPEIPRFVEGGIEKRLGEPGAPAQLRLEVPFPPASEWQSTSLEVLWELLPELLASELPGLRSRIEGERGLLEVRLDPELAELRLQRLRLAMARLSSELRLDEEQVATAVRRLTVRRQAGLEEHPGAAERVLGWWRNAGDAAVRERLFGLHGATSAALRQAAQEWLPKHPGAAVLLLPPQVLNPRFAAGPEIVNLPNDLSVAILERPATLLSVLCLRPVLLADVDGELAALVLARMAAQIRAHEAAPGLVQVRTRPATLELAAPAEQFAELCEVLQAALAEISTDDQQVRSTGTARRRALRLMAGELGLGDEDQLTPESLLRPDNIALGMVVQDAEAALEAIQKLLQFHARRSIPPQGQAISPGQRTREAAPGRTSVLVTALLLEPVSSETTVELAARLLEKRGAALHPEAHIEVLIPLVPGRTVLLVVSEAEGGLDELQHVVERSWKRWLAPVDEEELTPIRRRLAADISSRSSGAVGRARTCAAVAAGRIGWRESADLELEALTASPEEVSEMLAGCAEWSSLPTTGAGLLPIVNPKE